MSDKLKDDPPIIHIKVKVKKTDAGYDAEYDPKIINVTENDTVLNFRLVTPTPDDVIISSVAVNPEENTQLSTPSISKNGKSMTLSDVNTVKQKFNLTFSYATKKSDGIHARMAAMISEYPEIENDPPG